MACDCARGQDRTGLSSVPWRGQWEVGSLTTCSCADAMLESERNAIVVQSLLAFAKSHFTYFETRLESLETESHPPETHFGSGTLDPLACDLPYDWEQMRLEINFRHSGWVRTRQLVANALHRTHVPLSRCSAFRYCGTDSWIERSIDDPTQYRIRCNRCHDRFCLPCGQERSRVIAHNVHERLDAKHARFVTLTLKSSGESLADLLDLLYTSFAKLRRTRLWSQTQVGGVAFLEIKWSEPTGRWHPHLHILTEGKYLAKQALSDAWKKATGGSFIVDVRKIHSADRAVAYVVKYASKPSDPSILRMPDRLDEAIVALKGRMLCLTFGTWRGVKLTDVPDTGTWTPIAPLSQLIRQARSGNPAARAILSHLPGTALPDQARSPPEDWDSDYPDLG